MAAAVVIVDARMVVQAGCGAPGGRSFVHRCLKIHERPPAQPNLHAPSGDAPRECPFKDGHDPELWAACLQPGLLH